MPEFSEQDCDNLYREALALKDAGSQQQAERKAGDAVQMMMYVRGMATETKEKIRSLWRSCQVQTKPMHTSSESTTKKMPEETVSRERVSVVKSPEPAAQQTTEIATEDTSEDEHSHARDTLQDFISVISGNDDMKAKTREKLLEWCTGIEEDKEPEDKLKALRKILKATKEGVLLHSVARMTMRFVIGHRIIRIKHIRKDEKAWKLLEQLEITPRDGEMDDADTTDTSRD